MSEVIYVTKATYSNHHRIDLEFNDGTMRTVDFKSFLMNSKHPEVRKYLDENLFKTFKILDGDLDWNDYDLTFPIWDLYKGRLLKKTTNEDQEAS